MTWPLLVVLALDPAASPTPPPAVPAILIEADAALVLSGDATGKRLQTAVRLLQTGQVGKLLLTGAGNGGDDGAWLRARALELGVPPDAVLVENQSRTTHDNVALAIPIIRAQGWKRIALVTSPWHMPRALGAARKALPSVEWLAAPAEGEDQKAPASEPIKRLWYRLRGWM